MNKPSRHEIEKSLLDSKRETPKRVDRSRELTTNDSTRRQSRIIGGNLDGVRRHVPKKSYAGWILAAALVLFSGLIFIIPELLNDDAPKISQNKKESPDNDLYTNRIEENTEQLTPELDKNGFTVAQDRDRVAEYREEELKQQKLNKLKAKADSSIISGNYTQPADNNALLFYKEMLSIDSNNVVATDGISYMLTRLFVNGSKELETDEITAAKQTLATITEIDNESEEYFDLAEAIVNYEEAAEKKIRDKQIVTLFKQADTAYAAKDFIAPTNENAVFYYRQVLELEPENEKARKGIEDISQQYADLTEKHINNRDWVRAESTIKDLKVASKDSVLASFLTKRLSEAKLQPEPTPELDSNEVNSSTSQNSSSAEQTSSQDSQSNDNATENRSTIFSRQGEPAPIQDQSFASENLPERESYKTEVPVSDSLNPNATNDSTNNDISNNINTNTNTNSNTRTDSVANIPNNISSQQDEQALNTGLQAYYSGEYVTAFSSLAPLAERSNTRAQIRVGYMYQFGRGVAQDQTLGSQYLRTALPDLIRLANSNQSWAQSDLGSLYEDGIIVTRSYPEALNWYRKAAAQNYSGAQTNLGNMYFFGKGVEQSQEEAIKWYRLAALGGDAIAKQNLIQLGAVSF